MHRVNRIFTQTTKHTSKMYALYVSVVECISKGRGRNPYVFGVEVTVATTLSEGFVVGMRSSPGNTHDGHTLEEGIDQVSFLLSAHRRL